MNKFYNREASDLCKRELEVISVERDESGELTNLVVSVSRCDGDVSVEGTILEASVLNEVVRNMILEELNITDPERVSADKNSLTMPLSVGENFELPLVGEKGTHYKWEVLSGTGITINDSTAIVTRTDEIQTVELKATLSFGSITETKQFTIEVKKMSGFNTLVHSFVWNQVKGTLKSSMMAINSINDAALYCEVDSSSSSNLDINIQRNSNTMILVNIKETSKLNGMSSIHPLELGFKLNIYLDSDRSEYIGSVNGTVTYNFSV